MPANVRIQQAARLFWIPAFAAMTIEGSSSVFVSILFIYHGQNPDEVSRETAWREQLARTRIVSVMILIIGLSAL